MTEERKAPLNPDQLAEVLARLDAVMAEAERLRRQVTRQLLDQRRSQQQTLSTPSKRKRSAKRR
jgi:hypothetical protein